MKFTTKTALIVTGLMAAPLAHAGRGNIVFWEAGTTAIPTLGNWAMIAMAGLMAVMAVRLFRRNGASARVMSAVLVVGAVAVSVDTVRSGPPSPMFAASMDSCEMGSWRYTSRGTAELTNDCTNPIEITDYIYPTLGDCRQVVETCPVGTVLSPNQSCNVNSLTFVEGPGCD